MLLEEVLTLRVEEEKVNSSFSLRPSSLEKDFVNVDSWTWVRAWFMGI